MGVDPLTAGAFLGGGLLSGGGSFAGAKYSADSNERINAQNVALQREINAKNEGLMREGWQRDDGAVLRRSQDMARAGLSKTLAAGSAAAASSPIKLDSPKLEQTDNAWASAGRDIGAAMGNLPKNLLGAEAAIQQMNLSRSQVSLQAEQIRTEAAKQQELLTKSSLNTASSANQYAQAGFKSHASRIQKKDADKYEGKDKETPGSIDVRDKSIINKLKEEFPKGSKAIKDTIQQALEDPGGYKRLLREKEQKDKEW